MRRPNLSASRRAEPPFDERRLEGVRARRPADLEAFFHSYVGLVERMIARLVGPTAELEDLVQTTFAEALHNLSRFRGEARLGTWICSIAVHVAQHHLRAGRVRRHVPLELVPDDLHTVPSRSEGPSARDADQTIDGRRLAIRLHEVLDHVSAKKRIALLLYVIEEQTIEEVAALMNATQTATRSRIFFARRELRNLIAADRELRELTEGLLVDRLTRGGP